MNYKNLTGATIAIIIGIFAASNTILANRLIGAFKGAFNDPAIIAYANEQGTDLPNSPTTSPPNTTGQTSAPSKSPLSQSGGSSSSYQP